MVVGHDNIIAPARAESTRFLEISHLLSFRCGGVVAHPSSVNLETLSEARFKSRSVSSRPLVPFPWPSQGILASTLRWVSVVNPE